MRAWVIAVVCGACSGHGDHLDAGLAADARADADVDANEATGFRVAGNAVGVHEPIRLVLGSTQPDETILVTEDGAFRFPLRLPDQTPYTVTEVAAGGTQSCAPIPAGTIAGADAAVTLTCDGVTELSSVAFSIAVRLHPPFDPRATAYVGYQPLLLDPSGTMTVTTAQVDPGATVAIASSPSALDTAVSIDVANVGLMRTYAFALTQDLFQEAYLKADAPTANASFGGPQQAAISAGGSGVALSGDTLVVGAPGAGAVYVFVRSGFTWAPQQTLNAPVGISSFGMSVAIDGDTLVIGAPGTASQGGTAYVSQRSGSTWSVPAALDPGVTLAAGASYGAAVSISGSYLVVGAPFPTATGSVYIFQNTGTWTAVKTLTGAAAGAFGAAVAISGTTVAVGAPNTSVLAGAVFVYYGAGWTQMFSSTGAANSELGASVGLDADLLAVGAPGEKVAAQTAAGAVHLFRFSTSWAAETTLNASVVGPASFGFAVAANNGQVIVGAPNEDTSAANSGATYFFRKTTSWQQVREVKASNPGVNFNFGMSVAIDNDTFAAGAPSESATAAASGAAYVFR